MNHIENMRAEIKKYFDPESFTEGSKEMFGSGNGNFRIELATYYQSKPDVNWNITKVDIFDNTQDEIIFSIFCNDDQFFYSWLQTNEIEYLICAEDLFGGQTVVDLTNRKMAGYSPGEDGFIWRDFHLSPDGKTLATIGCYWACNYVIKLFDFTNPLDLPLPELKEIALLGNDEIITGWADNENLKTKGIKKEAEYFDDGSIRIEKSSEAHIGRLLNIHVG